MAQFKMIHVNKGKELQVAFLCRHCTTRVEGSEQESHPSKHYGLAGECSRCCGSGFEPEPKTGSRMCQDCGGTGVCPYCGGKYLRRWTELPLPAQDSFLRNWEKSGTFPQNYAEAPRFYRPVSSA